MTGQLCYRSYPAEVFMTGLAVYELLITHKAVDYKVLYINFILHVYLTFKKYCDDDDIWVNWRDLLGSK